VGQPQSPLQKALAYTEQIVLNHDQSSISIDFAALSFTSPGSNEYSYKMDGLDKEWTYLKHNRKVYFTKLAPGSYTFRVKASNSSGIWSTRETLLQIEVLPPFWASRIAYAIYFLICVVLIILIILYYNRRMREKNTRKMELLKHEKEKELYRNKIDFFTNVAHEIRTPLTLIQGPMENMMDYADSIPAMKGNLLIMERNTNHLLELTNQFLDFRQTEVKGFSLDFKSVNFAELLKETHSNFQPLADHHNLKFSLRLSADKLNVLVDSDAILKILNNLYSNAIKYATRKVEVIFSVDSNRFAVEIKNDGFKIPAESRERIFEPFFRLKETQSHPGTGVGLAISRNLTELHKGLLELKATDDEMNVFVLTLPIRPPDDGLSKHNNEIETLKR
jgi:signal transduction histidine kinase